MKEPIKTMTRVVEVLKVNKNDIPTKIRVNGYEYSILPDNLAKKRG
jgi:hypothetical protein